MDAKVFKAIIYIVKNIFVAECPETSTANQFIPINLEF